MSTPHNDGAEHTHAPDDHAAHGHNPSHPATVTAAG